MGRKYQWDAPAKLFFWPAADGSEEEAVYPTLGGALTAAGEGDLSVAWIVTESGDILPPRLVQSLRDERAEARRRFARPRAFLPWARAA